MAEANKFRLGLTAISMKALDTLVLSDVRRAIKRHAAGDWGEVSREEKRDNLRAIMMGLQIFSVYKDSRTSQFYIITELNLSKTTIVLPEEH